MNHIKQNITETFSEYKENFKIVDKLDPLLEDFIYEINKSKDITTIYSCQGHDDEESTTYPYLLFSISEEVWDDFWSELIPSICIKYNINILISDDEYHKGISIYYEYKDREGFWKLFMDSFKKFFIYNKCI